MEERHLCGERLQKSNGNVLFGVRNVCVCVYAMNSIISGRMSQSSELAHPIEKHSIGCMSAPWTGDGCAELLGGKGFTLFVPSHQCHQYGGSSVSTWSATSCESQPWRRYILAGS